MSENAFWAFVWFICATVIISIGSMITISVIEGDEQIVRMVQAGADPIAAQCAIDDSMGNNPTCIILTTKGMKNE